MRRRLRPRNLVLAAAALLAAAAAVDLLVYRPGHHAATQPAPPTAPTTTATTTAPPVFAVTAASAAPSPYAATLTWSTPQPASAQVYWGPEGAVPALWAQAPTPATSQHVTLDGLWPETSYRAEIVAVAADGGDSARTIVSFRTPPLRGIESAVTRDGVVRVNGGAFFPLLSWQECPDRWPAELAQGINLFGGEPCTALPTLLSAIAGRGLAAGTETEAAAGASGLLGWFYPDEADGRGMTADTLPALPDSGLRFLTLTNHFYSGAAPLPAGRGMYAGLIARADVVGFDLYPLQEWCAPARLGEVFDAQRELVALAAGRPTYQWIEVREMKCPSVPVTAAEIRAESWLAIAGGAHGLGFFPSDWGTAVGSTIRRVARRIRQLEPALLRPVLPVRVEPATSGVRASARALGGALYVIAVNPGAAPARVSLRLPGLGDRALQVLGRPRRLHAAGGSVSDRLPPFGVRIYVAPPEATAR